MKNILLWILAVICVLICCKPKVPSPDFPMQTHKTNEHSIAWNLIPDSVQLYEVAESYPDSIKVAFTRDGVFEDSIIVYKYGFVKDTLGITYPAYILRAAVGDMWIYDSNGHFVKFIESELPHSDKGHIYNP